jgi:hypothetical protein
MGEIQQVFGGEDKTGAIGLLREGKQPVAEHQRTRRHPGHFDGLKL